MSTLTAESAAKLEFARDLGVSLIYRPGCSHVHFARPYRDAHPGDPWCANRHGRGRNGHLYGRADTWVEASAADLAVHPLCAHCTRQAGRALGAAR